MAVVQTIGSTGADFTTPALAASAFVAGTGVTAGDDREYKAIENAAFNSTFLATANGGSANSLKFTVDASVRHTGFAGTGARLAISTTVAAAISDAVGALDSIFEWWEVTASGAGKIAAGVLLSAAFSSGRVKTVRNMLIHGGGGHSVTPFRTCGIGNTSGANSPISCNADIHNNAIWNWKSASTANAVGIGGASSGNTVRVWNNAVDDIDVTGGTSGTSIGIVYRNDSLKSYRNNVVTKIGTNTTTGTRACYSLQAGTSGMTATHNASDDTSAPGTSQLHNIIRGNSFNAPDSGDFRALNDSADIFATGANLGSSPTGVNIDLTGRDRVSHSDTWSRGPFQLSAGGAVSNGITVTAPTAFTFRLAADGTGTFAGSGTYTGTPDDIEYQVDGTGPWAVFDANPSAGAFAGSVDLPTGSRQLTFRFSNDITVTATVANLAAAEVVTLDMGQSNEDGRGTNARTYTASGGQIACVLDPDDTAGRALTDPTNRTASGGTHRPLVATLFVADRLAPIAFINTAEGGTSLSQWWNSGATQAKYTAAIARVTLSGTTPNLVNIDIGETDAINGTSGATFASNLAGWIADILARWSGVKILLHITGTTPTAASAAALDAIRQAQLAQVDGVNVFVGRIMYDRPNLHAETNGELDTVASRTFHPMKALFGGGTNARGPQITTPTLNAARTVVTVNVDKTLKAGLILALAPWEVSDNGTPATVSSIGYSGTSISLNLSGALSGPGGTCSIKFASGNSAAGLVVPLGNAADQPLEPAIDIGVTEFTPSASADITEGADTLSATVDVPVLATASITEAPDTLVATVDVPEAPPFATADITEAPDTLLATVVIPSTNGPLFGTVTLTPTSGRRLAGVRELYAFNDHIVGLEGLVDEGGNEVVGATVTWALWTTATAPVQVAGDTLSGDGNDYTAPIESDEFAPVTVGTVLLLRVRADYLGLNGEWAEPLVVSYRPFGSLIA